jgi:beta-galactosidase
MNQFLARLMRFFATMTRVRLLSAVSIFLIANATNLSAQSYHQDRPRQLNGYWSFELDRSDSGVDQKWFTRQLRDYIQLPGVLQSQSRGDEVAVNTPWVLSLYDRFWYLRQEYKDYAERNVKVPFLSQGTITHTDALHFR